MSDRQQFLLAAHQRFAVMQDPFDVEVAVEQRLVGLYSAAVALTKLNKRAEGREVLARPKCIEDLEMARDALSDILDKIGGK